MPACRRTRRGARSPFACARQLLDLADDEVALDAAQAVHEQRSVEVIHLVLKRACEQPGALHAQVRPVSIEPAYDDLGGTNDGRVEPGNAQAAPVLELDALDRFDLRVDDNHQPVGIAPDRQVDDEQPQRLADLRRGQPDARGCVHGFDHVVDQAIELRGEHLDLPGPVVQRGLSVLQDRANHQLQMAFDHPRARRAVVRFFVAVQFATSSMTESPPNFSMTASASTMATIASPTTAAAGTAQTSLRSIVAGLSVIVARSTERSGFISVEIGFMYAVTRRSSPLVTPPSRPPALLVGRATPSGEAGPMTISSCTREPGSAATAGPRPIPTALIAGIDISACASRPSSFRSHCT